jgi:hypothetical protein
MNEPVGFENHKSQITRWPDELMSRSEKQSRVARKGRTEGRRDVQGNHSSGDHGVSRGIQRGTAEQYSW